MDDHARILDLEGRVVALEIQAETMRFLLWAFAAMAVLGALGKWFGWW